MIAIEGKYFGRNVNFLAKTSADYICANRLYYKGVIIKTAVCPYTLFPKYPQSSHRHAHPHKGWKHAPSVHMLPGHLTVC